MDGLASHLTSNGVRAAVDPAKVQVPGVWIAYSGATVDQLDGSGTLALDLYLIVPDSATGPVLDALDELLGNVLGLVDVVGRIEPTTVVLPGNSTKPLPGYKAPVQLDYERTP